MAEKHTHTPWRVEDGTDLIWGACDPNDATTWGMGHPICHGIAPHSGWQSGRPSNEEREANAEFIVLACNSHAAMIAALEAAEAHIVALYRAINPHANDGDGNRMAEQDEVVTRIRAAIAQAKGE